MPSVFRPCIDLHNGAVKQIVGGTLDTSSLRTNFVSQHPSEYYAELYRKNDLTGGHVIKLGPGNDDAARSALQAWPNGLQVGGGINESNAQEWLDAGAEKVIVTSYLFPGAKFDEDRLRRLAEKVGKERLVVDVSCRRRDNRWIVAMDRWQVMTDMEVNAADVEGLCQGIDEQLVEKLGEWVTIPTTYAGGARSIDDLRLVERLSGGKVDLTFGSALDIFGGSQVKFDELCAYNREALAKA
ncbi:hypothetical protein Rhopal_000073-T1 [Rhodotorula paludigena]|uniref:1-(5-phosphoribosyl)-5-[(5-phosphoribosylamino)methylideneamino] imidazole-4-carboxamide isomerase n=1 Tax=Rhodotorula paludigena TaxID=86838 RepID=A0AAV5GER1_9BASI|nr:hypothetical protein Rhopal_000073-T1 [Rhodotorula paludigena]